MHVVLKMHDQQATFDTVLGAVETAETSLSAGQVAQIHADGQLAVSVGCDDAGTVAEFVCCRRGDIDVDPKGFRCCRVCGQGLSRFK
jgi:hypothetical protein